MKTEKQNWEMVGMGMKKNIKKRDRVGGVMMTESKGGRGPVAE